jgi:hypothetical protein
LVLIDLSPSFLSEFKRGLPVYITALPTDLPDATISSAVSTSLPPSGAPPFKFQLGRAMPFGLTALAHLQLVDDAP